MKIGLSCLLSNNDVESYDVNVNVKGIHIRFIPENTKGEQLTSRKFREFFTTAGFCYPDVLVK